MSNPEPDLRSARRAQREAERASRAQRKADAARQRALEAARAGGLFEGMEATSSTDSDAPAASSSTATTAAQDTTARPDTSAGQDAPATRGPAAPAATPLATRTRSVLDSPHRRAIIIALAVVSVILAVITGLASWQAVESQKAADAEQSIADAPSQATDAAREIATQMFTYDHRTVDADLAAVRERLTNPALGEFVEQSMPTVASAAKQQEATVYATVAAAAPQEVVDSDHVTVLVMLNRMVSTKEAPEAASSASRLSLEMVRVDGTWKLGKLNSL